MIAEKSLKTTNKNNPCPVCGDTSSSCRTHVNLELFLCATYSAARKLEFVGDWKCLKEAGSDRWASFKHRSLSENLSPQQIKDSQENLTRLKKISQKKEKQRSLLVPSDLELDRGIRLLASEGLDKDHRQDLIDRGLTDSQITDLLYFTITPNAPAPTGLPKYLPGIKSGRINSVARGYACIAFKGGLAIGYQIRLDNQIKNKYRWALGETSSHLSDGCLPLSSFLAPDVTEVFLMEGINKSAIAHKRHNISTIGASSGNFAASADQLKELLASLDLSTRITLVPDAGAIANRQVLRVLSNTAELVQSLGFKTKHLWWNQMDKTSPDIDELDQLDKCDRLDSLPTDPSFLDPELVEPILGIGHPESHYLEVIQDLGLELKNCATARPFDAWVTDEIFSTDYIVISGDFYKWQQQGYWQKQDAASIKSMIARSTDRAYKLEYSKMFGWKALPKHKKESTAFSFARDYLGLENAHLSKTLRTFRNGTLDLLTGELKPVAKTDYVTSYIDEDYIPNQSCPQVFLDFLESSFGQDAIATIRAVTATFLDPTAPWERFPYLIGESGGGKSTLGHTWGALFNEGYGAGSFSDFGTPESLHGLSGLSLFGIPDTKGRQGGKEMTTFYKIVSNEIVKARPLYQNGYHKSFFLRTWVASVNPLSVEEQSDGWERRALLLPVLPNPDRAKDPYLRAKIQNVRGQIISWAIAMPKEERDACLSKKNATSGAMEAGQAALLMSDPLKAWVDATIRTDQGVKTMSGHELHLAYLAYAREHIDRNSVLGYNKFIQRLKAIAPNHYVKARSERVDGVTHHVPSFWSNLDFVPYSYQVDYSQPNPVYICIRKYCTEGGLDAIAAFKLVEPIPIAEVPIAEAPIAEIPIAEIPIAEIPIAEIPVAEIPIAEIPVAEISVADIETEGTKMDLNEYVGWCLRVENKEQLEDFYGLAGFKANFQKVMQLMKDAAIASSNQQVKESIPKRCEMLEGWEIELRGDYPTNSFNPNGRTLTAFEQLERTKNKKETKKGKKND